MDLQSIERLPILKDALLLAGGLRFASVMDSMTSTARACAKVCPFVLLKRSGTVSA